MSAIQRVVIIGGCLEGVMTAHAIKRAFGGVLDVSIVDDGCRRAPACIDFPSESLGFFREQGLDDDVLVKQFGGLYRLANKYLIDEKESFYLPFTPPGFSLNGRDFHHFYVWAKKNGMKASIDAFSISAMAAKKGKFYPSSKDKQSLFSTMSYGYTIDSHVLEDFFRHGLSAMSVSIVEGAVKDVSIGADGSIHSVFLGDSRQEIKGDFFIDCSGPEGRLISTCLSTPYLNKKNILPINAEISGVFPQSDKQLLSTEFSAGEAGFLLKTGSQTQTHVAYFYNKNSQMKTKAESFFRENSDKEVSDARFRCYSPGYRKSFWVKNCVAIGESAGFLGEFYFSRYALAQSAISRLINFFPSSSNNLELMREYNRVTMSEYEHILDFHALHYFLLSDSTFLESFEKKGSILSSSFKHKLIAFAKLSRVPFYEGDPVLQETWAALLLGFGMIPESYDAMVDTVDPRWIIEQLNKMAVMIDKASSDMPLVKAYLQAQK